MSDSNTDLESLGVKLVDQDELETSITKKANAVLISKDKELDEKRLEKTTKDLNKTLSRIKILEKRLSDPRTKLSQRKQLKDEIEWFKQNELEPLQSDINDITSRLKEGASQLNETTPQNISKDQYKNEKLPGESERDFLIRTGKITAFGNENAFQQTNPSKDVASRVFLRAPGFEDADNREAKGIQGTIKDDEDKLSEGVSYSTEDRVERRKRKRDASEGSDYGEIEGEEDLDDSMSDNFVVEDDDDDDEEFSKSHKKSSKSKTAPSSAFKEQRNIDDGDESFYQARLKDWTARRSALRSDIPNGEDDTEEWFKPHPSIPDAVLNPEFKLPGDIYPALLDYQKTCVQWLWELYTQKAGGIIGDEMGLGKTIQIIAFLAGLHYSGLLDKPVLVVVPATVLNQWVNEFHKWWPPLRCVILHSIGSGMTKSSITSEEQIEAYLETQDPDSVDSNNFKGISSHINAQEIIDRVCERGHVLVTTYVGLRIYSRHILPKQWGYVVLDEGHKIRNPDSDISLTCKQIKTYNRVILSGTPIQNNLKELWSLFDFVFPGRLGTLPVFEQQFSIPINMGGYANASNVQVQTGYKCAVVLRDLVSPYLLRRLKNDVAQDLPKKNEMVLFVKLTQFQQDMYEKFLGSEDLNAILKGRRNVLMGVDILRKICNHPDLVDRELLSRRKGYNYGSPTKSGKMQVLKNLLQLWQKEGHRTLLFCQTKQMLDILEKFVANLRPIDNDAKEVSSLDERFNYLRMDGSTAISKRQDLVDTFNSNHFYHVFLLTTKVGGLGVNLTGADRVIIFDPDWNPSTDIQARERAWRLGQKKDITIYRLMTAGSIEEKIYHRQIFKTFLTNKILKDPKQRRFFKMNDLHDLFTLGDPEEKGTETGDLFNGSEVALSGKKNRVSNKLFKPKHKNDDDFYQVANIMGVSKLDEFEGDPAEGNSKDGASDSKDENRIMAGLFANSGVVHSTLKHDDIMDSSKQELTIVEREASKVANEAAEMLKKSRKLARKNEIGTPTWTGKFGAAGKFGPKFGRKQNGIGRSSTPNSANSTPTSSRASTPLPKDNNNLLSSTSILSDLKQNKLSEANTKFKFGGKNKHHSTVSHNESKLVNEKQETLSKLINYFHGKSDFFSTSNDILKNLPFKVDVKNEKEMVMIRSLLREIADWDGKKKGWKLKDVFQIQA